MNMIRLKCQNCGANLDLDMDHLMAYCPFCGQKLLFDVDQIGNILLEKEKTKQKEMDHDLEAKRIDNKQKRAEQRDKNIIAIIALIMLLLIAIVPMIVRH